MQVLETSFGYDTKITVFRSLPSNSTHLSPGTLTALALIVTQTKTLASSEAATSEAPMIVFALFVSLWIAFPVAALIVASFVRPGFDASEAAEAVKTSEIGDWASVEVIDQAATTATVFTVLADRAERLYGDRVRAASLRNAARRTLARAWEVSARVAFIPFGLVSMIAAMHSEPSAPSYIPAVTHCETRELVQGQGSVRSCTVLPAIRCTGDGASRVCRSAK